jgi:hypothetical protein
MMVSNFGENMYSNLKPERELLQRIKKDRQQPRPEANTNKMFDFLPLNIKLDSK